MEIKSKFLCSKGVALAFAMLLGGSPGVLLYANDSVEESLMVVQTGRIIKGLVTDANGEPLIGCNVVVIGSNAGVITDIDGRFTLNIPADAKQIKVSYIGYVDQIINLHGRSDFKVVLKEDNNALDEVVVVGYGTQKKATLTGAVEQIGSQVLESRAITNVGAALQGATPGLVVTRSSSRPGNEGLNFQIRGLTSVNGGSPLIIVDGVPVLNSESFQNLNSDDIENISVLKDGSASIYGAKAANGVILVTTKRGAEGKVKVNYSGNVSFSQPTRIPEMLNSYQYATYVNEFDAAQGNTPTYSETAMAKILDGSDPISFPDTDWWDSVTKNWATNTQHSLSVSGGNDKLSFYSSAQYAYQDAIYKNTPQDYNQYQFTTNIDAKINKSIKFSMDILGRQEVRNRGIYSTEDLFGYFLTTNPMSAPYYPNGLLRIGYDGITNNALLMVSDTPGTNKTNYHTLNLKPKVRIDLDALTPGLYAEGYAALDYSFNDGKSINTPYDIYSYSSATDEYTNHKDATGAISVNSWSNKSNTITLNARIGYTRTFNEAHRIDAFASYEQSKYNYSSLSGYRTNYLSSALPDLDFGSKVDADKDNGGNSTETARQNWFGRINYGYKDKYLAEFTIRYDGSMNFAQGHRWGVFPSVSAAWVISQEDFFEPLLNVVNFFKIKGSWGMMGNDNITAYQYLSMYSFNSSASYAFGTDPSYVQGVYETRTANPLVTWEKAKTWNVGFSAQFLSGKLGLDFDYFQSRRNDILITRNASVPTYSGLSLPAENLGKVKNHGFEVVATYRDKAGDFEWGATGNLTYANNEVVYMDEATKTPEWQRATGHPIDGITVYKAIGIYQTQEEIDATPHLPGTKPGDLIYQDTNGDKSITWDDAIRIDKSTTPKWIFGLTLNGAWKGIDLNVFFQGQADAEQLVMPAMNMPTDFYEGRWIETNTAEENASAKWPRAFMKAAAVDNRNSLSSTWWLRDASFVRLKSVELGYTFPNLMVKKLGLEKLRIYANGNNLFTIDSMGIFDPEMTAGIKGYPIQRTLTFGVNVTF